MSGLRDTGVETSVHFRPLHHLHWFRAHAEVGPGGAPVADRLAGRALSLPLHLGLREDDVGFVCERIANMMNE
jgi:perosamine synthetase